MSKIASPSDRVVVVTGAAKGLGYEWVKQYSSEPDTFVVAVVRKILHTDPLHTLAISSANVGVIALEMSDYASFERVASEIAGITGNRVDILLNNAGAWFGAGSKVDGRISESTPDEWKLTFDVNTIAPLFFFLALQPQLANGKEKKIVAISSFLASAGFHHATDGGYTFSSYSAAKVALNMASLKLHYDYRKDGFIFITLNPGYVQTDLHKTEEGKQGAPLTADVSVNRMKTFVSRLTLTDSGKDFSLDGSSEPLVQ